MMLELIALVAFSGDVRRLGSESFAEREAAEARLSAWSSLSWRTLDRKFPDPEVRRRAARVLRRHFARGFEPPAMAYAGWRPRWVTQFRREAPDYQFFAWRPAVWVRNEVDGNRNHRWGLVAVRDQGQWWISRYGVRDRVTSSASWVPAGAARAAGEAFLRDLERAGLPRFACDLLGRAASDAERRCLDRVDGDEVEWTT